MIYLWPCIAADVVDAACSTVHGVDSPAVEVAAIGGIQRSPGERQR